MNYPITLLINNTANDIYKHVKKLADERNIPMDLMTSVMDSVTVKIQNEALSILTDLNIETMNALDMATKEKDTENKE